MNTNLLLGIMFVAFGLLLVLLLRIWFVLERIANFLETTIKNRSLEREE